MLWTIFVILVVLWLLGFLGHVGGALIHLLLVIAVVVLIVNLIQGRRPLWMLDALWAVFGSKVRNLCRKLPRVPRFWHRADWGTVGIRQAAAAFLWGWLLAAKARIGFSPIR